MATTTPPKINDTPLPATPAHEWAQETSSKLQATTNDATMSSDQQTFASSASTPGVEVPGSYPRNADAGAPDANPAGVLDMAKQYLPAQQDVQQALKNATETAKQYLPQAVASYLPGAATSTHLTTLPSQDGPQKPFEHSDGVGSLPGNPSEPGVARLPDEREAKAKHTVPSSDGVGDLPGSRSEVSVAKLPDEREAEAKLAAPSSGGVGDLPGSQSEVGVARLPDEREAEAKHTVPSSGGVGDLPGSQSEASVAKLPEERALEEKNRPDTSRLTPSTNRQLESVSNASIQAQLGDTPAQTSQSESSVVVLSDEKKSIESTEAKPRSGEPANLNPRTHPLAAKGAKWKGVPLDESFQAKLDADSHAQLPIGNQKPLPVTPHTDSTVAVTGHEKSSNAAPPINGKFTENVTNGDSRDHHDLSSTASGSNGSDGSHSVGGTPRKAKLMDKIKGEAKVISGKLGGKEEKVEEGRRLMGKA